MYHVIVYHDIEIITMYRPALWALLPPHLTSCDCTVLSSSFRVAGLVGEALQDITLWDLVIWNHYVGFSVCPLLLRGVNWIEYRLTVMLVRWYVIHHRPIVVPYRDCPLLTEDNIACASEGRGEWSGLRQTYLTHVGHVILLRQKKYRFINIYINKNKS